jgi:hypothetical protein
MSLRLMFFAARADPPASPLYNHEDRLDTRSRLPPHFLVFTPQIPPT